MLFLDFVAQHSVLFDPNDALDLGHRFAGVAVPKSRENAVRKRQIEFFAGRFCARQALAGCAPAHADTVISIGPKRDQ